ncbi:MAG TPA: FAD:protein FMN transferase [Solirubrobacteraceae bacterium]|jgi:thiamine biosynthesis lipoprotein|nr:FAD:protein FMN transferase [Solirubrobacteraceae bacterium]
MSAQVQTEASSTFACFGAACAALVSGDGGLGSPTAAVAKARARLLAGHRRFSRFEPTSELSRLNADPRKAVPVSVEMARFIAAAIGAARSSDGLVDATLLGQLVRAGYERDLSTPVPLAFALTRAPERRPARSHPAARWQEIEVDRWARVVRRPPGLMLDSGGIVKGLLADLLGSELATHASFAIDCAGDLRIGGSARRARPVHVASPFEERILHTFYVREGGIATSGIGRRSWLDADGAPAHHLLDPASGRPAFTGIVQATALAPSALEAEMRAKAALLAGPEQARRWLSYGGLLVHDDGTHSVLPSTQSSTKNGVSICRFMHRPAGTQRSRSAGLPALAIS